MMNSVNRSILEYPLLEIRRRVLFPGSLLRLQIGQSKSVRLIESIWESVSRMVRNGKLIAVCTVVSEGSESTSDDASFPLANGVILSTIKLNDEQDTNIYRNGTLARVVEMSRVNASENHSFRFSVLVEGIVRFKVDRIISSEPYNVVRVQWLEDKRPNSKSETEALAINLRNVIRRLLDFQSKQGAPLTKGHKNALENLETLSASRLADVLAPNLVASAKEKQMVLAELDVRDRIRMVLELASRQLEVFKISEKIHEDVEGKMKNTQREYFLRQQLRAIKEELSSLNRKKNVSSGDLGAPESDKDDIDLLDDSLKKAGLPREARQVADRELQRLRQIQPMQPEYTVMRSYLEFMAELPWSKSTQDNLDIANAETTLNHDHHALDKVKKRIVEFLAVRSIKVDIKGPILCLVGPPGVGKTSLGKSVADALGRKFRRLALGGVRDEAEIRGHRRTYVGALAGSILTSIKRAESNNPVILLDEIDKLSSDVRGDPSSALLEVLDPEQNNTFMDHYLGVPFDLSKVFFIATANRLDTIPSPLRDRMEVVELPGYTNAEKLEIATRHLVPKQLSRHGITSAHIELPPAAVDTLISSYTREAGVRNLEREIAAVCRFAAVRVAESRDRWIKKLKSTDNIQNQNEEKATKADVNGPEETSDEESKLADSGSAKGSEIKINLEPTFSPLVVTVEKLDEILGPARFESEIASRTAVPGVATGLAWTSYGGEILFIEAWLHRGTGRVTLTGQLGSVMQESARAALSFIRGNLQDLGVSNEIQAALGKADLHVHVPAGAVPKDGPSAGVAVTAAILSALSGRRVRADTACTGEITLRGLILPVGGIKEKVLAAHRAGIKRLVLPSRNRKNIKDIPDLVKSELDIYYSKNIVDAMDLLFEKSQDGKEESPVPRWLTDVERHQSNLQPGRLGEGAAAISNHRQEDTICSEGQKVLNSGHDFCGPDDLLAFL